MNDKIKLEEGEVICDKCNGTGEKTYEGWGGLPCDRCLGHGKLDWIENMMGKKRDRQVLDGTSFVPYRFTNIITSIPSGPKVGDLYVDGDINIHKYTDNKWKIIK